MASSSRRVGPPAVPAGAIGSDPSGAPQLTELGIDVVRVARIRDALQRFGSRFAGRVLTPAEAAYVRDRPEHLAGRWAAKEAVSKVLGLGVRGVGWQEIEVVRLPTGQPAVRLSGRARARAAQLGMGRIAVSISHEREYAVAVAVSDRTTGGDFVFPADLDERLDDRERRLVARLERLRALGATVSQAEAEVRARNTVHAEEGEARGDAGAPRPAQAGSRVSR